MATNLSSLYQQRKQKSLSCAGGKPSLPSKPKLQADAVPLSDEPSPSSARKPQAAALVSAGGELGVYDEYIDDLEETLRRFDMDMAYGPCLGLKRIERWERAKKLGLNPPTDVKEILLRVGGAPACLWEGRV